ncbi:MAG TPA: glycosyl hydrolase family 18 protein [Polyangia bacterium]|nr:glycosyl hydrolase family 18 protein [Polyangia bacterium]
MMRTWSRLFVLGAALAGCSSSGTMLGGSSNGGGSSSNGGGSSSNGGGSSSNGGGSSSNGGGTIAGGGGGGSSSAGGGGTASGGGGGTSSNGGGGGSALSGLFVGYYQSWSDSYATSGADTVLAKLPAYVNVVNLAFMQPDTTYVAGSLNIYGTTFLDVPYDGPTLKDAITALHASHPATKILVSVGGATLYNWAGFQPAKVAALVNDFGLDGVDVDYEPATPNCAVANGSVTCPSDAEYISVIKAMRAALPRPKLLSIAGWSVGAYGEDDWATAPPLGSASTGLCLALLHDADASAAIDWINVMSYDASDAYSPEQALAAYQHYFKGPIAMGIEVPPEAWGGHVETTAEIDTLGAAVKSANAAGLMLWSIQKAGPAQQFATEMCTSLGLADCASPMM